jgi:hypothetical protein
VTRFNMDQVLALGEDLGVTLAGHGVQPFASTAEMMLTYDRLPYMGYGRIDEFCWLAEQALAGLRVRGTAGDAAEEVARLLEQAEACAAQDDDAGEAASIVQAYQVAARAW